MIKTITEGAVKIYAYPGAPTKKARVFYNPEMRLNRDISVLVLKAFQQQLGRKMSVADVLAATGVRGIRYAKEVGGIKRLLLNDLNPSAVALIKRNLKLNKVRAEVTRDDANAVLSRNRNALDAVDIDPFGPPVDFLDSAARAVSHGGLLMITATDTAPLAGTYPKTCLRRYGAQPLRTDWQHEIGMRILLMTIARECAKYDKAIEPVFVLAHKHSYRVFCRVLKSKTKTGRALKNIGYAAQCKKCGWKKLSREKIERCENCRAKALWAGPLWVGKIFNPRFAVMSYAESLFNAPIYDTHQLCRINKCAEPPKVWDVIERLQKAGHRAAPTHFSPMAVRTDAPIKAIAKIFK